MLHQLESPVSTTPPKPAPAPVTVTASQNAAALSRAKIGAIMDWGRCPPRHQ